MSVSFVVKKVLSGWFGAVLRSGTRCLTSKGGLLDLKEGYL
jgi:hypothetical protein